MTDTQPNSPPATPERSYPLWSRILFVGIPLGFWLRNALAVIVGAAMEYGLSVVETVTSLGGLCLCVGLTTWAVMPRIRSLIKGLAAAPVTALSYRKRMMLNFIGQMVILVVGLGIYFWPVLHG